MKKYSVLISETSHATLVDYLNALKQGLPPGNNLKKKLCEVNLATLPVSEFLEILMNTKRPQIFAEQEVAGDGSDWNQRELAILGDVSIATPVVVYDDGLWASPNIHTTPFEATLLFTPGALLISGAGDWKETVKRGAIDSESYLKLYERRLLPCLKFASDAAKDRGKKAFITLPGLGCGEFAGNFRGKMSVHFKQAIHDILKSHLHELSHIKAVYFNPYSECTNERHELGDLTFFVRPLAQGNKSQLCLPEDYQEKDDDFSSCELFSFVAWDHVSWPGNDFYVNSRNTDDGVKAAATSSMMTMTGIMGKYDPRNNQYRPPAEYRMWEEVVSRNKLKIRVKDNLLVL